MAHPLGAACFRYRGLADDKGRKNDRRSLRHRAFVLAPRRQSVWRPSAVNDKGNSSMGGVAAPLPSNPPLDNGSRKPFTRVGDRCHVVPIQCPVCGFSQLAARTISPSAIRFAPAGGITKAICLGVPLSKTRRTCARVASNRTSTLATGE